MKFLLKTFLAVVIISALSTGSLSAQSAGGLQNQDSSAQPTAPLQNDTAKVQQEKNPDIFSQDQSSSLKVYGNPNQSSPSAEVGAASTTNQPTSSQNQVLNYWLYAFIFISASIIFGIVYLFARLRYGDEETEESYVVDNTDFDREVALPTKEPKSSKPKTKKKRKKKAHR